VQINKVLKDYTLAILIAISVALLIRSFIFESFKIPTQIMSPTLLPGDILFAEKLSYLFKDPNYGDIVVFEIDEETGLQSIRRIVAKSGDTVQVKNGELMINATELKKLDTRCYLEKHPKTATPYTVCLEEPFLADFPETKIPPGYFFLLGDFRGSAVSSTPLKSVQKNANLVPLHAIKARAFLIWLSLVPQTHSAGMQGFFPEIRSERLFKKIH